MRKAIGASSNQSVLVNGVELAYDDAGTGPPIVCLHAIGHGAADYRELRDRLKSRFRVIALDWPGQGASGEEDAPPGASRYAEHLRAFIEKLGLSAVILIGNSVGGAAAIRYAAQHPERVRALVVANSGGLFMRAPGLGLITRAFARFFEAGAAGAGWFPLMFSMYYRRILVRAPAEAQRSRIIAAATELAPLLARAWRGFGEPDSDVRAFAARVGCPVLVTWATLDPVNPLWLNRAGIRCFRDARLVKFRAGHAPFLETPDEFVEAFTEFVARVPEARA